MVARRRRLLRPPGADPPADRGAAALVRGVRRRAGVDRLLRPRLSPTLHRPPGARVALGEFRADAVESAAQTLPEAARRFAGTVDVRDERSVAAFVTAAEAALAPVDIVVASAGIYPNSPVLELATEEWDRVMD